MSDKLKIMQTRTANADNNNEGNQFCASIGYPKLKLPAVAVTNARRISDEKPVFDDSAFNDYASKAESKDFVGRRF